MDINITTLYYDYNDKSGEQTNQINKFVAAGLLYIIGNYFSKWSSYFVLTLCCRNNHTCYFYNDIFHKIFAEWKEWPLQIVIVEKNKYLHVPGAREYNIIFTDSYEAFVETEIHTYTANYNTNEYYYIFLQARDHLLFDEMQKIFEYCWQHYLINCIIQIQNAKGQILFYTYYPFTTKYCGQVQAILINEFNGTALLHKELFPPKLKNFYGCPLKAALWNAPPYMHLSKDSKNRSYISGGFEGKLLLELAKKLNFTLIINIPENDSQRGDILRNGSLTGALQMLHERQADLSVGSFRQSSERSLRVTPTISYYQTIMALVVLSDAFLLTSLETILYPFTTQMWCLYFAIVFFAVVLVGILRRIYGKNLPKKAQHTTLDVLLVLLGMPAIYKPKQNVVRILNATWMAYGLLTRTIYQALLFQLIRVHVHIVVPQTLEDVAKDNYALITNLQNAAAVKDISFLKSLNFIMLDSLSNIITVKYLEKLTMQQARNVVATVPLDVLQYYVEITQKAGSFQMLPHNIMNLKYCIYLTKHSFLTQQFDDILVWMQDFGLVEAWLRQVLDRNYYNSQHLQGDRMFGLQHLCMAFMAVLIGHCVATLIFLIELLYKKFQHRKFMWK